MKRMLWMIFAIGLCGCETAHQSSPTTDQSEIVTTILTQDGKPASGATAVLVPPGHEADVTDGEKFDDDPAYQRCTADNEGRIRFHAINQLYLIVVIHSSGCACFDQVPHDGPVRLKAWGRIEGRLLKSDRPDALQEVSIWRMLIDNSAGVEMPNAFFESTVKTGSDGTFVIPRVAPGSTTIGPDKIFSWGEFQRPLRRIDVEPGKTATITLGGKGRALQGHVELPAALANRTDWRFWMCSIGSNDPQPAPPMPESVKHGSLTEQAKWWEAFDQTAAGKDFEAAKERRLETGWATGHGFDVAADGDFRIEDVTAGNYSLYLDVVTKHAPNVSGKRLGFAEATFTVPPMTGDRSNEPLTIPAVRVQLLDEIKVGDVVPDFVVPTLDDRKLRLADFRGKVVLLEFWATWCGPCVAQTQRLKQIYQRFGSDPRFAMISLSLDPRPDDPIQYVARHAIAWHEGFLGDWHQAKVAHDYHVEGIPSFWLIGTDGKLLAEPKFSGEDLSAKIEKALDKGPTTNPK
jgi:thiol-disulfide isomerase/thioredoxin